ncbi:MAG: glycosyltransferase family 4 protein [Candidatus Aenigmatarchaeota archaeon]
MEIMITSRSDCNPWITHWLKCFKDKGHTLLWVTFGEKKISEEIHQFLKKENIEHIHFPVLSFKRVPIIYERFKQEVPIFLKRFDVDAVISGEFFWISTVMFRMFSTKNFYSYTYENHLNGNLKKYSGIFSKFWIPIVNKIFKGVIVPVRSTKRCWEKLGLKNIWINPLGVDVKFFRYSENRLLDELKLLYVGRIIPEKGLDYLLKATSLLDFPYSLTIAGSGKIEYYSKMAQNLGCNVNFLGQVEYHKLPKVYQEHNVLILPSITTPYWKEQLGMVLIEAMATGRIVVGSDSGAIPEVVGNAGLIVPERSVKALRETLVKIYRDKYIFETLPKKARQRVEKYFDLKKNTSLLIELMESNLFLH